MDKSRKRMRSAMLLTTVALAGSAGATFNFSFGASGGEARPPQGGTKIGCRYDFWQPCQRPRDRNHGN